MGRKLVETVVVLAAVWGTVPAGAPETRKIQDNSFLIEEAYNQEDGVIQHIQSFQYMKGDTWAYTFTQEWPVPTQQHQLSHTIPYLWLEDPESATGFGDVLLNYRYQAVLKGPIAFAPRLSLLLPTGHGRAGRILLTASLWTRWCVA